ncbi:WLM-domain-containing protein [Cystobasidium minutum MCA 4210]|uniref:WLM-domain-containing protein n=1 Tax=Cystobasidium minutum MCA 4210 TaxID=1397322 RepID=UPI0034CDD622|eukprot:jgi/Rhomi1/210076/estExt_Genemark1.C_3_t20278
MAMSSSSWSRSGGNPGDVGEFKIVKDMPRMEEALELLKKLHSLCKPIQKKYGWYLPTLTEFFPSNPNLLGMNRNHGETILIRLRPADDKSSFLPLEESLVGTLLHEFTHNVHGPHHKQFYEFLDKLQDEYDVLRTSGYTGEGFLSQGRRAGTTHDLPSHLAKQKALQNAQKREQIYNIMGPAGGSKLGTGKPASNKTPKQMAAEAAERRARDDKACGHGEAVPDDQVEEEVKKAAEQSTTLEADSKRKAPLSTISKDETSSSDSEIEIIEPATPSSSKAVRAPASSSAHPPAKRAKISQDRSLSSSNTLNPQPPTSWICSTCTFENDKMLALACDMCGAERYQGYQSQAVRSPQRLAKAHKSTYRSQPDTN